MLVSRDELLFTYYFDDPTDTWDMECTGDWTAVENLPVWRRRERPIQKILYRKNKRPAVFDLNPILTDGDIDEMVNEMWWSMCEGEVIEITIYGETHLRMTYDGLPFIALKALKYAARERCQAISS